MMGPTTSDVHPTMAVKIFSAGVAACVADAITFPLDTAKVRLQVARGTGMEGVSGRREDSGFGITALSQVGRAGGHLKSRSGLTVGLHALGLTLGLLPE